MRPQRLFPYAASALFVILADQITKLLISGYLTEGESVSVVGDIIRLQFVLNEGGAMGTSLGPSWIYIILTAAALILIVRYFLTSESGGPLTGIPLALIFGGAVGNLIDRIRFGEVIDFIDVDIPDVPLLGITRWWTFNIADAAITCGLAIFVLALLFDRKAGPIQAAVKNESYHQETGP